MHILFEVLLVCFLIGTLGLALRIWILHRSLEAKANKLREEQQNFQQILDAINDFVLVKGPKSRLLWANTAFREYYGMTNEQLRNIIDAPFAEPDNTQQYVKDDAFVFDNAKTLDIPEEPVTRFDGVVRKFHTVKSPIFNEKGEVIMTAGVSRDITDRKEQERLFNEQRARMISSAKMSSLGEMAGGIAHEINNPLAIIQGLAEEIIELKNEGSLTPEESIKLAEKIRLMTVRIAKIVKGLKSFAREATNDPLQEVALKGMIEESLELCQERFRHAGIELTFDSSAQDLKLECRSVQISQVLLNLLNNAHDALEGLPVKKLVLSIKDCGDSLELSVADSGPGVPAELKEKIFEPFFTTKVLGKGTGLGLGIAKGIVESHGGSLWVQSAELGGACFVMKLPKKAQTKDLKVA